LEFWSIGILKEYIIPTAIAPTLQYSEINKNLKLNYGLPSLGL